MPTPSPANVTANGVAVAAACALGRVTGHKSYDGGMGAWVAQLFGTIVFAAVAGATLQLRGIVSNFVSVGFMMAGNWQRGGAFSQETGVLPAPVECYLVAARCFGAIGAVVCLTAALIRK